MTSLEVTGGHLCPPGTIVLVIIYKVAAFTSSHPTDFIPISHLSLVGLTTTRAHTGCGTARPRPAGRQSDDSQWVLLDQRHKAPFVERVELIRKHVKRNNFQPSRIKSTSTR